MRKLQIADYKLQILKIASTTFFLFLFSFFSSSAFSQTRLNHFIAPSDSINKKRVWFVNGASTAAFSGMLFALKFAWYENYDQTKFHFFNDNGEWLQMDKAGHTTWNYNGALAASEVYEWAGVPRRKAVWYGAGVGFAMEMVVESLDGFSAKWGFSPGDFACDLTGASLLVGQEYLWRDQRIKLKYTAYEQHYSPINLEKRADDLYGPTFLHRATKDYNTQTYWACINIKSFLENKNSRFPNWLGVAIGYSTENLFNGHDPFIKAPYKKFYDLNGMESDGTKAGDYELNPSNHPRYRQVLFSLDVDLTRIKTKNKYLKTIFRALNVVKLPAPALEYNSLRQIKFHPFYF